MVEEEIERDAEQEKHPHRTDRVIDVSLVEGTTKHVWAEPEPLAAPVPPTMLAEALSLRQRPAERPSVAPWVVAGAGGASLVVGAVAMGLVAHEHAVNDAGCSVVTNTCTQTGKDAAGAGRTLQAVGTAALVVGAAGVATGGIWLGLRRAGRTSTGVGVSPAVGGAALRVGGSW